MKKIILFSAFTSVCVFVGCYVPSLHPLYTKQDLLFNPNLLGQWIDCKNEKSQWIFSQKEEKSYTLRIIQDDKRTFALIVHLLKVGDTYYLDLFPDTDDATNDSFILKSMLPIHTFIRIRQMAPTLEMDMMNSQWITHFLTANPKAIKHEVMRFGEKEDPLVVLTAWPKEIQAFFRKQEKTEQTWSAIASMKKAPKQ